MNATSYLFAANVVVWVGLAGYVLFLGFRGAALGRRVEQLEMMRGSEPGHGE